MLSMNHLWIRELLKMTAHLNVALVSSAIAIFNRMTVLMDISKLLRLYALSFPYNR
jgi:hypothetical protein